MLEPYDGGNDVRVLPTAIPLGPEGHLMINAYVLLSEEPVLVDSGLGMEGDDFVAALSSVINPRDIQWIWLTHDDADHTGNIQRVMEIAPRARLVTNAFNAMRMSSWWPVPLERVYAIRPGDQIEVGDRTLRAVAPPVFDNPMSIGLFDESKGSLFTVDAFGAIIPELTNDADAIPAEALAQGMLGWGSMDAPWTQLVDRRLFSEAFDEARKLQPSRIFSSHLPASGANVERFANVLQALPDVEPELPPDQPSFAQMLEAMAAES